MKKWLTAGAKSGNLGESSTALETVTRERIQSVSQQFFTEIWGLGESRQRGAPSYEYKKRVEARDALVKAFLEQYDTAKAPTGDSGIEIKSRIHAYLQEGVLLPSTTSRRLRCVQTWMKRR